LEEGGGQTRVVGLETVGRKIKEGRRKVTRGERIAENVSPSSSREKRGGGGGNQTSWKPERGEEGVPKEKGVIFGGRGIIMKYHIFYYQLPGGHNRKVRLFATQERRKGELFLASIC